MGMKQNTTFTCDQCGTTVELEGGAMGSPAGWLPLSQAGTSSSWWFHAWECVRDFAAAKAAT